MQEGVVGLICFCLLKYFPFSSSTVYWCCDQDPLQARRVWLLHLLTVHCLYVCNCKYQLTISKTYNPKGMSVCIGLSGTESQRQVEMGRVMKSGSLGGVMVRTLAWNARYVDWIPALDAIFPIFIVPTTLGLEHHPVPDMVVEAAMCELPVCSCVSKYMTI